MSKIKMRCITCGKWFQSANAKEVTCPDCMQKVRREKMAAKTAPPASTKTPGQGANAPARPSVPPPKPKPAAGERSHWFDSLSDVKVSEPEPPPQRPRIPSSPPPAAKEQRSGPELTPYRSSGPGDYRSGGNRGPAGYREREREGGHRGPGAYRVGDMSGTIGQRPRQPMEGGPNRGPRQGPGGLDRRLPAAKQAAKPAKAKAPRPPAPPKPKQEKTPPPPPFKPTPEQVALVETRYLELAVPAEYDGIRTQISKELNIPKKAVKQIIKDLRERQNIPSWWELQTYKGDSEELEKIKAAYEPYLPLPPIGVHKQIAEALSLKAGTVYQAIKLIRQEMNLPQYNDPTLHGLEPDSLHKKKATSKQEEAAVTHPEAEPASATTETPETGVSETQAHETLETALPAAMSSNGTTEANS